MVELDGNPSLHLMCLRKCPGCHTIVKACLHEEEPLLLPRTCIEMSHHGGRRTLELGIEESVGSCHPDKGE